MLSCIFTTRTVAIELALRLPRETLLSLKKHLEGHFRHLCHLPVRLALDEGVRNSAFSWGSQTTDSLKLSN